MDFTEVDIIRTEETIAVEIRTIVHQTQKTMLDAAVEIGRRLKEAKELVPHGEWGEWLEKKIDFSQRSASNYVRIFEEYGDKQLTLFGAVSNSQTYANLSFSKALALLSVPEEEREEFVEVHNVDDLSTRELETKIKALQEEKSASEQSIKAREEALRLMEIKANKAKAEADELKKQLAAVEFEKPDKSSLEVEELKLKLEISEKSAENVRAEIEALKLTQGDLLENIREEAREEAQKVADENAAKVIEGLKAAGIEAEKKAGLSIDQNLVRFKLLADQLQIDFNNALEIANGYESDMQLKLKSGLAKILEVLEKSL